MSEIIFLVEEADEGGFTARALGESIFTEANTLDDLREMVRDAVRCHFEEGQQPKLIRLHFVREENAAPVTGRTPYDAMFDLAGNIDLDWQAYRETREISKLPSR
ncbi:MAG TPA: hypothetical protein VFX98_18250 [Longimicrobiaceae bacterium]|nr:hypothetical protein [Longimicrobiaceae bacterium]